MNKQYCMDKQFSTVSDSLFVEIVISVLEDADKPAWILDQPDNEQSDAGSVNVGKTWVG